MTDFVFSPEQGFLDTGVYTDPTSGTEARTQLMSLHAQTRDFINNTLIKAMDDMQAEIDVIPAVQGDQQAIQDIMDGIAAVTPSYMTDTISSPTADTSVYDNGYLMTYTDEVITSATEVFIQFPNDDYTGRVTWETLDAVPPATDGTLKIYFEFDPTGLAIRMVLFGTQAV